MPLRTGALPGDTGCTRGAMKSQTLCGGAVCGLPTRGKAQGCRAPHSTVASWPTSVAHEWQVPALPIGVGFRAGQRVTLKALPDPFLSVAWPKLPSDSGHSAPAAPVGEPLPPRCACKSVEKPDSARAFAI